MACRKNGTQDPERTLNQGPYEDPGPYEDSRLYQDPGLYEDPGPYEDLELFVTQERPRNL